MKYTNNGISKNLLTNSFMGKFFYGFVSLYFFKEWNFSKNERIGEIEYDKSWTNWWNSAAGSGITNIVIAIVYAKRKQKQLRLLREFFVIFNGLFLMDY